MLDTSFFYIVAEVNGALRYVTHDGSYSDDFDLALRFDNREAAERYQTSVLEKHRAKVLLFTA